MDNYRTLRQLDHVPRRCIFELLTNIYRIYQLKFGSNLPSYGWLLLNEGWCVTVHHITIRNTQWRVVCELTSRNNEKCEAILNEGWCVSWHHVTMRSVRLYSMKGGVWVDITTIRSVRLYSWLSGCRSQCSGCMNVAWGLCWGESWSTKPCVFPCKAAAAGDERYVVCAAGAAEVVSRSNRFLLCSATSGCSCLRSSLRFLILRLQIAV